MRVIKINENRFKLVFNKFRQIQNEQDNIYHKIFVLERKIENLEWRSKKEISEHEKTLDKRLETIYKKLSDLLDKNPKEEEIYRKMCYRINPKADKVIAGNSFEKELSTFSEYFDFRKTIIRQIMVERNKIIRERHYKPRSIRRKYRTDDLSNEKKELKEKYYEYSRKLDPFKKAINITGRNREKIKKLKKRIRDLNKSYRELEKQKPEWKGMSYADEYYSQKDKIKDKFISLDIKKQDLEEEINKIAKETNEELFKVDLRV